MPLLRSTRSRALGLTLGALVGASAVFGLSAARVAPAAASEKRDPNYLWIPPGEYTAIVVCSSGQQRRWVVALESRGQALPITVGPEETVVIPFHEGWAVNVPDNARLASQGVLWGIDTTVAGLTDESTLRLDAWGITKTGPVKFVTRQ